MVKQCIICGTRWLPLTFPRYADPSGSNNGQRKASLLGLIWGTGKPRPYIGHSRGWMALRRHMIIWRIYAINFTLVSNHNTLAVLANNITRPFPAFKVLPPIGHNVSIIVRYICISSYIVRQCSPYPLTALRVAKLDLNSCVQDGHYRPVM